MSLATVANWGFNLIVSATFLDLVITAGNAGTFLIYAALSLLALAFVVVMVPETKGRSLEQIELDMERVVVRLEPELEGATVRRAAKSAGANMML
jgi:hypothetical protein